MTEHSKPLVVVLSRNYSTGLGVIRSLGSAGYAVDLIASVKKTGSSVIASGSKYVRKCTEVFAENIYEDSGESLLEALMEYAGNEKIKPVLFPTDDFTASIVSENHKLLAQHFSLPHVREGEAFSITDAMDKTFQSDLARRIGIATPAEWKISLRGKIEIDDELRYPCFVKPLQSVTGHKTEMRACESEEELYDHLLRMKERYTDREVLVQEYLTIDKEYDLSGVCVDQQIIIPAIIEKTRVACHERGVTMTGKMIPVETLGHIGDKLVDMLKEYHYTGMFDMELNLCGDKLYFNEVNLRSGGPNFSYFLNGVNLPDILVKELTGEGHNREEEIVGAFGKTFIYEKVAWEDYIYSYMTGKELKKLLKEADFTLLANSEDPNPGKVFNRRIRMSAVKHKLMMALGIEKNK